MERFPGKAIAVFLAVLFLGFSALSSIQVSTWAQPAFRQTNQWLEDVRFQNWQEEKSTHFTLRYLPEDLSQVPLILREAEKVHDYFAAQYGFTPRKSIQLVLYPDRAMMRERFGWSKSESATGVYLGGVIYLLSPTAWLYPKEGAPDEIEQERLFHQEGPLYHEYTHFYLDLLANNNFPRWYTEGLAQLIEYETIQYEWLSLKNRLHEQRLYTIPELARFDELENTSLAYRQVFRWLYWIQEQEGRSEVWNDLNKRLANSEEFPLAWQRVFGEDLESSWQKFAVAVQSEELR